MDEVLDLFYLAAPALVLLAFAALAAILCWRHGRALPLRAAAWLLCAPTLVTLFILVCGALFQAERFEVTTAAFGPRLVSALFVFELSGLVGLAWWFRRFWTVVLPLAMAQAWFACVATGFSYMSVTGNWI